MRITLTLDDDLDAGLRRLAARSGRSLNEVVNEILRRGLSAGVQPARTPPPLKVVSAPRGFMPGVDPLKLNQLVDELEVDRFLEQSQRDASGS